MKNGVAIATYFDTPKFWVSSFHPVAQPMREFRELEVILGVEDSSQRVEYFRFLEKADKLRRRLAAWCSS